MARHLWGRLESIAELTQQLNGKAVHAGTSLPFSWLIPPLTQSPPPNKILFLSLSSMGISLYRSKMRRTFLDQTNNLVQLNQEGRWWCGSIERGKTPCADQHISSQWFLIKGHWLRKLCFMPSQSNKIHFQCTFEGFSLSLIHIAANEMVLVNKEGIKATALSGPIRYSGGPFRTAVGPGAKEA